MLVLQVRASEMPIPSHPIPPRLSHELREEAAATMTAPSCGGQDDREVRPSTVCRLPLRPPLEHLSFSSHPFQLPYCLSSPFRLHLDAAPPNLHMWYSYPTPTCGYTLASAASQFLVGPAVCPSTAVAVAPPSLLSISPHGPPPRPRNCPLASARPRRSRPNVAVIPVLVRG